MCIFGQLWGISFSLYSVILWLSLQYIAWCLLLWFCHLWRIKVELQTLVGIKIYGERRNFLSLGFTSHQLESTSSSVFVIVSNSHGMTLRSSNTCQPHPLVAIWDLHSKNRVPWSLLRDLSTSYVVCFSEIWSYSMMISSCGQFLFCFLSLEVVTAFSTNNICVI